MGAIAEAIVEYGRPLMDQTDGSQEQMNKACALTQFCFNLALLPEESREEAINDIRSRIEMADDEFVDFRDNLVVPMIRRHEEMFPRMHGLAPRNPFQTNAPSRSSATEAAAAEMYAGTDRYAPCPCNSGKKYKFCCGAKGR